MEYNVLIYVFKFGNKILKRKGVGISQQQVNISVGKIRVIMEFCDRWGIRGFLFIDSLPFAINLARNIPVFYSKLTFFLIIQWIWFFHQFLNSPLLFYFVGYFTPKSYF